MQVQAEFTPTLDAPLESKKRMIEVVKDADGWTTVSLNSSSLDLIQTCLRKSKYVLVDKIRSKNESPALIFGTSIHKALEVWYASDRSNRKKSTSACEDFQAALLSGNELPSHSDCIRCATCFAFLDTGKILGEKLLENDKRSLSNGLKIINAYCDQYIQDPFKVFRDDLGPVTERSFDLPFFDDPDAKLHVRLFGQIDVVLTNEETNSQIVCDHKTTSSLGVEFFSRLNPNFQYVIYSWAAKQLWNIDSGMFLVNGIQVAKTMQKFSRQIIKIGPTQYKEMFMAVNWAVRSYLLGESAGWPQSAPNPCSMYGGCSYRTVCEAPEQLRASIIKANFIAPPIEERITQL